VTVVLLVLIVINIVLIGLLLYRPATTKSEGGKILAFFGLFILPVLSLSFGTTDHMEHSKSTEFCLSCHEMEPYGRSLRVDDEEFLPAVHYQNRLVPREETCFTCHTHYTMFGGLKAKMQGLQHLWVHYTGGAPEKLSLYADYQNRNCLHCHLGSRKFEEQGSHHEDDESLAAIKNGEISCLTSGCHQAYHDVEYLDDMDYWEPKE